MEELEELKERVRRYRRWLASYEDEILYLHGLLAKHGIDVDEDMPCGVDVVIDLEKSWVFEEYDLKDWL